MDEALIGIVREAVLAEGLTGALLGDRIEQAFAIARRDCRSLPADAQFRGALAAVMQTGTGKERVRIEAELENMETVAKCIRQREDLPTKALEHPIGLIDLWKQSKPGLSAS